MSKNFVVKSGHHTFDVSETEINNLDIVQIENDKYHLILDNTSYEVDVIENGPNTKEYVLSVNGREYQIAIKDELDLMIKDLGLDAIEEEIEKEIRAPMPGLVIDVFISKGDEIKTGDNLVILEAMKMENILKSHGKATIKSVKIKKGDTVDKDQILIELA